MATKKTSVNTKKTGSESEQPKPKKRISKFGKMANSYAGKIKEYGNVWDL